MFAARLSAIFTWFPSSKYSVCRVRLASQPACRAMALVLQNRDDVQKNSGLNALGQSLCQPLEMNRLHNTWDWFRFGMTIPTRCVYDEPRSSAASFTSTG